ncbi:glycosyltransferase family 4 protein [bacterium]|nr:glycosyltransferase family 4 protein [bacterium]
MGTVAYHQARALAATGARVRVLTPRAAAPRQAPPGVELVELPPLLARGNAACLPQVLWRLGGVDVVHLHYPFFGTAELLAARRLLGGPRLVLQYQMDVVGVHWKARLFHWHRRLLLPAILRLADAIVVTSHDYAASSFLAPALPALEAKLVAIPGGVDLAAFAPGEPPAALRARLGLPDRPTVFFLARLDRAHYFKGLHVLIEALAQIPEAALVVGGDGEWRGEYEAQARARLGERVRFVGDIGDRELPDHYRAADVLALPSIDRTEAFGLVLLEALACGTPVVASRLPGVRTLVDDGRTGFLVDPGDPIALAARLAQCLRERGALSPNAVAFARARYGWDAIAGQLLALYQRLLAGAGARQ